MVGSWGLALAPAFVVGTLFSDPLMHAESLRVLLASRRLMDPNVWCAGSYELEDMLTEIAGAEVMGVTAEDPKPVPFEGRLQRGLDRFAGLSVKRNARWRPVTVTNSYDLFMVRVMTPHELDFLEGFVGWRERSRLAVCWIEELWANWVDNEGWLESLRRFDHIFVEQAFTVEPLQKLLGRPCHYIPPAVDALRFCPYPDPPDRTIDLYAMGRRGPATHEAALDHARRNRGFFYVYDSVRPGAFTTDSKAHRDNVINLIQRSRYFIANRAKVDTPDQNEDQQEYGPRFFEGTAGGAILIGEPPKAQAFDDAFDWPDAIVPLDYDSKEIIDVIRELERDPERVARARRANIANTLRRHDWVHRWRYILDTMNLPVSEGAQARSAQLQSLASSIDHEQTREDGVQVQ